MFDFLIPLFSGALIEDLLQKNVTLLRGFFISFAVFAPLSMMTMLVKNKHGSLLVSVMYAFCMTIIICIISVIILHFFRRRPLDRSADDK